MNSQSIIWQINVSDVIQIVALLLAVYVGYWLSERSRSKEELQREYATVGHPFGVLLREVHGKAIEIDRRYHRLRKEGGAAGLELRNAINSFAQLTHLKEFYEQKQ